ncbi:MAG: Ig-like domain-containing protein, partial [Acidobacteriota bacterium]
ADPQWPQLLFDNVQSYLSNSISEAFLAGDHLYLTAWNTAGLYNLSVLDLSDPSNPILSGTTDHIGGSPTEAVNSGGFLLATNSFNLMAIHVVPGNVPYPAGTLSSLEIYHLAKRGSTLAAAVLTPNNDYQLVTLKLELAHHGTSLTIASPADGGTVTAATTLPISVTPNTGFDGSIELYVNGKLAAARDHAPYDFQYWVPSTATGTLSLQAVLRNDSGQLVPSNTVTLQVAAPDTTPPQVVSTNPADQTDDAPMTIQPSAAFSEPLEPASVNAQTVKLVEAGSGTAVSGTVVLSTDGKTVTFQPNTGTIKNRTSYTFELTAALQDPSGNSLGAETDIHFTTLDQTPPSVTLSSPVDGDYLIGGGTELDYRAEDNVSIASTSVLVNGQSRALQPCGGGGYKAPPGLDSVSSYGCGILPTLNLPFGFDVTLQAQATDEEGNTGASEPVQAKYLCDAFQLFNRSDLSTPIAQTSNWGDKVVMAGDVAVAAGSNQSLISGPPASQTSPVFVPASGVPGGILLFQGNDVAVQGNLVALAARTQGIVALYDISDPSSPVQVGTVEPGLDHSGSISNVWLSGRTLLVKLTAPNGAQGDSYLAAYDISSPKYPVFRSIIQQPVDSGLFAGSYFVAATSAQGTGTGGYAPAPSDPTQIYDYSDPAHPAAVASIPEGFNKLRLIGNRFLFGQSGQCDGGRNELYDFENPQSPQLLYQGSSGLLNTACDDFWTTDGTEILRETTIPQGTVEMTTLTTVQLQFTDTTPPTAAVVSPADASTVDTGKGWWRVQADVQDNVGVAWVDLYVDGTKVERKTSAPWTFTLPVDPSKLGDSLTVQVRAGDLSGNQSASPVITAQFGSQWTGVHLHPSGTVTAPAGGALDVSAEVYPPNGVDHVDFTLDGAPLASDSSAPFQCRVPIGSGQAGQTLTLEATAYNADGSVSSADSGGNLSIQVVQPQPDEVLQTDPLPPDTQWIHLSPDGTTAALDTMDGVDVVSTGDWSAPLVQFTDGLPYAVGIRPDGDTIVLAAPDYNQGNITYSVASLADGTVLRSVTLTGMPYTQEVLSPDGRTLAYMDDSLQLVLVDLDSMTSHVCCSLSGLYASPDVWSIAYFSGGGRIVATIRDGSDNTYALLPYDLASSQWLPAIPIPEWGDIYPLPDGTRVWIAGSSGSMTEVDLDSGQTRPVILPPGASLADLAFHPGGAFGRAADWNGSVFDLDTANAAPIDGRAAPVPSPVQILFEPHGRWSYVLDSADETLDSLFVGEPDIWAPRLNASIPNDGGSMQPDGPLTLYLSEPMSTASISSAGVAVTQDSTGQAVSGTLTTRHEGTVVTWTPSAALAAGNYTVTVS